MAISEIDYLHERISRIEARLDALASAIKKWVRVEIEMAERDLVKDQAARRKRTTRRPKR
jgi:uncharacterized protein (DUF342 family)